MASHYKRIVQSSTGNLFFKGLVRANSGVQKGMQADGAHGDSGGPAFVIDRSKLPTLEGTQLAGVLSNIMTDLGLTSHVDLHSSYSQQLLKCVMAAGVGANIPGITPENDGNKYRGLRDLMPSLQSYVGKLIIASTWQAATDIKGTSYNTMVCLVEAGGDNVYFAPCSSRQVEESQATPEKVITINRNRAVYLRKTNITYESSENRFTLSLKGKTIGYVKRNNTEFRICHAADLTSVCRSGVQDHPDATLAEAFIFLSN